MSVALLQTTLDGRTRAARNIAANEKMIRERLARMLLTGNMEDRIRPCAELMEITDRVRASCLLDEEVNFEKINTLVRLSNALSREYRALGLSYETED
jgi:uncharacterized protein YeeX (DUF496 family)